MASAGHISHRLFNVVTGPSTSSLTFQRHHRPFNVITKLDPVINRSTLWAQMRGAGSGQLFRTATGSDPGTHMARLAATAQRHRSWRLVWFVVGDFTPATNAEPRDD